MVKRFLHFSARALRAILLGVLFLVVAIAIFLNSSIFDSIIRKQIETRLGKAMKREVHVGSAAFNPFLLKIHLTDFVIGNDPRSPEVPFFSAKDIYAQVSWRQLLGGRLRVSNVRLQQPELNIFFYIGGGSNFPKFKSTKKKGKGIDFVVERFDCNDMFIRLNQRRLPLSFSIQNLQTAVEYDYSRRNYVAATSFKDGFLKIQNFEFFKFDLKANYRIISGRLVFSQLQFLSSRSKFYMAGEISHLSDPIFDMRFRSQISLPQAKEMFHFGPEMTGSGTFRATYKGTFTQFRMLGDGLFQNFVFYSLPIDTARFDLDLNENQLNVSAIRAEMFGGSYRGTFSIAPLKGNSIFKTKGDFANWDGKKLGRFIRMNDMVIPSKGSGSAAIEWAENTGIGRLKGDFHLKLEPYDSASIDLAAEAERTNFDNSLYQRTYVLPVRTETRFHIEQRQIRDLISHLETPYTTADISGTIDYSGEANLEVSSRSEKIAEIDLLFHHLQAYFKGQSASTQEFWTVSGAADFDGKMDATVWSPFEPRLSGKVAARNASYHGITWDRADADIVFYQKKIDINDSLLSIGNGIAKAQGSIFLEDKAHGKPNALNLTGSVQDFPMDQIPHVFHFELPVEGTVNATLELKGPFADVQGRTDFETGKAEAWGEQIDHAKGTVLFFPDSLGLRDITASFNGGYAQGSGDLVYDSDNYNVQFQAENIPVEKLQILQTAGIELTGRASARGSGEGTIRRPNLNAELQLADLHYKGEPYGDVHSVLRMNPDTITLQATGVAQGITSYVNAKVQLDGKLPMQASFDINKFPLEILTRIYAPHTEQVTGLIGGKFQLSGTLNPANIEHLGGSLDAIQLNAFGIALTQARPVDIELSDRIIHVKDSLLQGDHLTIGLSGNIYPGEKGRLDLDLSGNAGLELLSRWNRDITSSGTASAKISIGGTFRQPSLTGVLEIKNGFFRHFSFPNSLTEIAALVTFKNQNVSLQSFQAKSSGGTLTAGGTATLKGYSLGTYRMDVYADKIRVQYPEGLRSTVNAELHLQNQGQINNLVGDVEVIQGVYTRSFEESPDVFGSARVPTFAGLAGAPSGGRQLRLNIHIHSDNSLLVRNNFANIETSADLNVTGSLDDPVLVGRIEVNKGTITFQNREYRVVRGSLALNNPYRTEPVLNFVAETRIRQYNVTLNFSGTFDRIYHDITSDPPLAKDEIYALLGIGTTQEESSIDVSTLLVGEEISRFIANPIASPLERGFRKVFGLQRFQIDPTYVESTQVATARITLQKALSNDFTVTYSTNLFTAAEEIILLQYQVTDEIQVTASKDERARYGVDVVITKTFE